MEEAASWWTEMSSGRRPYAATGREQGRGRSGSTGQLLIRGGEPGVPAGEAAAEVVVEDAGPDLQGDDPVHIRCVQGPGLASSAQRMGAAA